MKILNLSCKNNNNVYYWYKSKIKGLLVFELLSFSKKSKNKIGEIEIEDIIFFFCLPLKKHLKIKSALRGFNFFPLLWYYYENYENFDN